MKTINTELVKSAWSCLIIAQPSCTTLDWLSLWFGADLCAPPCKCRINGISLALQGMIKYVQRTPPPKNRWYILISHPNIQRAGHLKIEGMTKHSTSNASGCHHAEAVSLVEIHRPQKLFCWSCLRQFLGAHRYTETQLSNGVWWHNIIQNRALWFTTEARGLNKHQPSSICKNPRKLMSTASLLPSLCPSMSWGLQSCCLSQTTPPTELLFLVFLEMLACNGEEKSWIVDFACSYMFLHVAIWTSTWTRPPAGFCSVKIDEMTICVTGAPSGAHTRPWGLDTKCSRCEVKEHQSTKALPK